MLKVHPTEEEAENIMEELDLDGMDKLQFCKKKLAKVILNEFKVKIIDVQSQFLQHFSLVTEHLNFMKGGGMGAMVF